MSDIGGVLLGRCCGCCWSVVRFKKGVSVFFLSSRRRHTRCALVTGVQTCALPISSKRDAPRRALTAALNARLIPQLQQLVDAVLALQIGRASCRERVCQYV